MKFPEYTRKKEFYLELLFYLFVFSMMLCFAILQPLGDPPDETNRYKVAQFICIHGRIPHGANPEVAIGGYGASYAFQPILPYIIQGYLMRIFFQFTQNGYIILLVARLVNVAFGVTMAIFVRKISKLTFTNPLTQWVFTALVVLLPQNIFLHTYVNTDSMAALSASIIIYACLKGLKENFQTRTCILLSVGIIFCALSYYNAYGVILCSILLFIYSFLKKEENGKLSMNWKLLLSKGAFVSILVLIGIGWWFVHNALLYDGDFLGMTARTKCAIETALPAYNPLLKETFRSTGKSIFYVLTDTIFFSSVMSSFIATFGPMSIITYPVVYFGYKLIFLLSALCILLPRRIRSYLDGYDHKTVWAFNIIMILDIIIPAFLCVWYSYSWDFQPQGRYILPLLIPFMYYLTIGISKLITILNDKFTWGKWIGVLIESGILIFTILSLLAAVFGTMIPYYLSVPNMFAMFG